MRTCMSGYGRGPCFAIFVRPATRAASRAARCSLRARALRPQPPLDAAGVQNAAGDLLDGALGGIEPRQRVAREQRLRGAQLVLHLLLRGVAAVRAALGADLLQPLRFDGQRIELGAERLQWRRQSAGFEIVLGERIVGGEHPVLQRQIQAGRSLADPRYSDQHHIGERVVAAADRKSTRLNSSHSQNSYAVFCLKKKKKNTVPLAYYSYNHYTQIEVN